MDHSLFPTETKLKFYIERLIYGVAIAMPLQPMVGDVLLWLAVGLAIVDLIRSRSLATYGLAVVDGYVFLSFGLAYQQPFPIMRNGL